MAMTEINGRILRFYIKAEKITSTFSRPQEAEECLVFAEDANISVPQDRNDDAAARLTISVALFLSPLALLAHLTINSNIRAETGSLEQYTEDLLNIRPFQKQNHFILTREIHCIPTPLNDSDVAVHATINMSSIPALQGRLKELSTSLAQIHPLVSRLHNFTTAIGQGDEARLELGTEIHSLLKEAETQLELLKVEVEALKTASEGRRKGLDNEKELERERVIALAGRLAEDLKK
jgi:hypothetical protein